MTYTGKNLKNGKKIELFPKYNGVDVRLVNDKGELIVTFSFKGWWELEEKGSIQIDDHIFTAKRGIH